MKLWTKAVSDDKVSERELSHQSLARSAAAESIVLLKNDGTLPIQPERIALFGAGAVCTIKGGTGSGEVNERHAVTILEGLKNAGFTITTEKWLNDYIELLAKEKKDFYKTLLKKSKEMMFSGDDLLINFMAAPFNYPVGRLIDENEITQSGAETCIYVISRQTGECSDRSLTSRGYALEQNEIENIKKAASYKKTIVVINASSSMDLTPLDEIEGINAIVYFCQQGMEGGSAFADIITGKSAPSGCLTNTWAKKYDDIPFAREYSYLKGKIGKEYYREGIYVGYRYFDSFDIPVRYEFGFGLNYSDFSIECADVRINKSAVTVLARVTNTGNKYSGKKTAQVYISCPDGKLKREYQSLAAFCKTRVLASGESEELQLTFDLIELAGYDEQSSSYLLDKGDYILRLGSSSRQTRAAAVITLDETAVTEKCERVCPLQSQMEELSAPASKSKSEDYGGILRLAVKAADIPAVVHKYEPVESTYSQKVNAWMENLSIKDKFNFITGTGYKKIKRGFFLPGAAAHTTSKYTDMGISSIALCDGPAGLRIQPISVIKKSGAVKGVKPMLEIFSYLPNIAKKFISANAKRGKLAYQYTTAFPVGTALAQTWNTGILESFGKAVGCEMKEYGATYWLAPGMNIQRNPLCGRNFEYFSEDPLLTGKTAAAITRGVQSYEGCYVTIKHYAANNQETGRNRSDSVIGGRALREIYLKGFKIAVRESGAKSVMTSYNLLNGIYTANSFDLCVKLLRQEWGFKGVVMSDWYSTGNGMAGNGLAVKSGNDLIMPGGKVFIKRLKADLKNGLVSEEDISRSCANILEAIANSAIQKEFEEALRS